MAAINANGISTTTLSEYKTQIETLFKSAFGNDFSVDAETAQGQLIGQLALAFSETDSSIIDMFNGTDIYSAIGIQIDYLASNLRIERKAAQNSEAVCTLTGVGNTLILAGATAEDTNGLKYKLKEPVTISPQGIVSGIFVCQTDGAIVINANTITKIMDVVVGWETISNPSNGVTGYLEESNSALIIRYVDSVATNSVSQLSSLTSAITAIADVKLAVVVQNDEDIPVDNKGITLLNNSMAAVVFGGDSQDIINAIGKKKPLGIKTNGDVVGQYVDEYSFLPLQIKFYRAAGVPIEIQLSLKVDSNFPSNGISEIKDNLVSYFEGTFSVTPGFYKEGMKIGKNVIYSRLFTPINQVVGHELAMFTIGKLGRMLATNDVTIKLNELATLVAQNININVI